MSCIIKAQCSGAGITGAALKGCRVSSAPSFGPSHTGPLDDPGLKHAASIEEDYGDYPPADGDYPEADGECGGLSAEWPLGH
jgi:hypothetical protein